MKADLVRPEPVDNNVVLTLTQSEAEMLSTFCNSVDWAMFDNDNPDRDNIPELIYEVLETAGVYGSGPLYTLTPFVSNR